MASDFEIPDVPLALPDSQIVALADMLEEDTTHLSREDRRRLLAELVAREFDGVPGRIFSTWVGSVVWMRRRSSLDGLDELFFAGKETP